MRKFNKKSAITFIAALFMSAIGTPHAARAVGIDCSDSMSDTWYEEQSCSSSLSNTNSCLSGKDICYQMVYQGTPQGSIKGEKSCTSCPDGYRLTEQSESIGNGCTFTYNVCEKIFPYSVTDASSTDNYTCSETTYAGGSYHCPSSTTSAGIGSHCSETDYFCFQSNNVTHKITYCTKCPSGYRLQKTTQTSYGCKITYDTCERVYCMDLPCEGHTRANPKDDTSNPGRQIYCDISPDSSTDKCMYRCDSGYYDSSYVFHESPSEARPSCKKCPSGASCYNNKISCNIGHYLSRTGGPSGGLIANYTYSCNRCPEVSNNAGFSIYGTTDGRIYNDNEVFDDVKVKSSVTLCYIPPDVHITTKEGHEYRFKSNCNYSPGSGVVIVPGN